MAGSANGRSSSTGFIPFGGSIAASVYDAIDGRCVANVVSDPEFALLPPSSVGLARTMGGRFAKVTYSSRASLAASIYYVLL